MKAPATVKNQIAALNRFHEVPDRSEPFRRNGDEAAAKARRLAAIKLLPEERAQILTCRTNDN